MRTVLDVLGALSILAGSLLTLSAAIGLVRFPDLLSRIHAATKPQTLGLLLVLLGIGLRIENFGAITMLIVVALMQLMTAPIAAHMVSRTAVRSNPIRKDLLVLDEYHDN